MALIELSEIAYKHRRSDLNCTKAATSMELYMPPLYSKHDSVANLNKKEKYRPGCCILPLAPSQLARIAIPPGIFVLPTPSWLGMGRSGRQDQPSQSSALNVMRSVAQSHVALAWQYDWLQYFPGTVMARGLFLTPSKLACVCLLSSIE